MRGLLSFAYPAVLLAGLVAAVVRRRRLGPAAGLAIAGFAVLFGQFVVNQVWGSAVGKPFSREWRESGEGLPDRADIPLDLLVGNAVVAAANTVGLLLLVAAVVRRRRPEVLVHDEEVAGRGE